MGMFDTFRDDCPNCGKLIDIQSKLGDCLLNYYKPGDKVKGFFDCSFRVKDECSHCGHHPTVHIEDGKFTGLLLDPLPTSKQEMHWGSVGEIGVDDSEEQMEEMVESFRKVFDEIDKVEDED